MSKQRALRHRLPLGSQRTSCGIEVLGKMRPSVLGGRDGEATTIAGTEILVSRLGDAASINCERCRKAQR